MLIVKYWENLHYKNIIKKYSSAKINMRQSRFQSKEFTKDKEGHFMTRFILKT